MAIELPSDLECESLSSKLFRKRTLTKQNLVLFLHSKKTFIFSKHLHNIVQFYFAHNTKSLHNEWYVNTMLVHSIMDNVTVVIR